MRVCSCAAAWQAPPVAAEADDLGGDDDEDSEGEGFTSLLEEDEHYAFWDKLHNAKNKISVRCTPQLVLLVAGCSVLLDPTYCTPPRKQMAYTHCAYCTARHLG